MRVLKLKSPWSSFPGLYFLTWLQWVYRIQAFDATKARTAFLLLGVMPVTVALGGSLAHCRGYEGAGSMFSFFYRLRTKMEKDLILSHDHNPGQGTSFPGEERKPNPGG